MNRRRRMIVAMPTALALLRWGAGRAEPFPYKPVKLIAGHSPGGQSDVVARTVAPKLAELLGQPIVIENRSGAAGLIAASTVAKAPPDGHTLLISSSTNLALARVMVSDLPFDPTRDFAMLARLVTIPTVLVAGSWIPATTVPDLVEYAKARPGRLAGGSSGTGSSSGFTLEMLKAVAGIDVLQVPYSGLAPAVLALVSRQIDLVFADYALVSPHLKSGALRLLGTPASRRQTAVPELPTLQEQGFDVVIDASIGIVAPAGISREIQVRLSTALADLVRASELRQRLLDMGFDPLEDTPARYAASLQADIERFSTVARRLGMGAVRGAADNRSANR